MLENFDTPDMFCSWARKEQDKFRKMWLPLPEQSPCNEICGKNSGKWYFLSPMIDIDTVNSVNATFTLLLDYRSRNPTVFVLVAQKDSETPQQFDYKEVTRQELSKYKNTVTVLIEKEKRHLYIGLFLLDLVSGEPPECVTVSRAIVSYRKCLAVEKNMAVFPNVSAPHGDKASKVEGTCRDNTVPVSPNGVWLYCDRNGSVTKVDGCQCRAGFESKTNDCTRESY